MLSLPKKTIESIKNALLRQEKEVEKELQEIDADDPAKPSDLAESSEPGTDSYIADTHAKTMVLEGALKKTKTSIKTALVKITKGTYGKCEKCNKQIGIGRLLAMPTAALCMDCSVKRSKSK